MDINGFQLQITLPFATFDVLTNGPYSGKQVQVVAVPEMYWERISEEQRIIMAKDFKGETAFLCEPVDDKVKEKDWEVEIQVYSACGEIKYPFHSALAMAAYLRISRIGLRNARALVTKYNTIHVLRHPFEDLTLGHDGWPAIELPHDFKIINENLKTPASKTGFSPLVALFPDSCYALLELPENHPDLTTPRWEWENQRPRYGFSGTYYYVHRLLKTENNRVGMRLEVKWSGPGVQAEEPDPAPGNAACALCAYLSLQFQERSSIVVETFEFEITQRTAPGERAFPDYHVHLFVKLKPNGTAIQSIAMVGDWSKTSKGHLLNVETEPFAQIKWIRSLAEEESDFAMRSREADVQGVERPHADPPGPSDLRSFGNPGGFASAIPEHF